VPASPSSTPIRVSLVGLAAALIGAALLVLTVRRVGWVDIRDGVSAVGGWFAVVVALGGLRFLFRARSWMLCATAIGASGLSAQSAFGAVLAGDAVGNLTPLGLLASEPTKVWMVRRRLATGPAVTSVALDNGFYTLSVLVMVAAGAWLLVRQVTLDPVLRLTVEAVLAAVAMALVVGLWLVRRRPAIVSRLAQLAARLAGRAARTPAALHDIETRFYGVVGWPPATLARAIAWQVAFHVGAIAEVWVVLRALSGGQTTLSDAFVLESAGRLVTVLFKVVPYRMGVDEVGAVAVATALGVPPSHGVALALIRKIRILVWNAVGLAVLARARR
jgi:Lysylphosphatidylglycerol synthase TM region